MLLTAGISAALAARDYWKGVILKPEEERCEGRCQTQQKTNPPLHLHLLPHCALLLNMYKLTSFTSIFSPLVKNCFFLKAE